MPSILSCYQRTLLLQFFSAIPYIFSFPLDYSHWWPTCVNIFHGKTTQPPLILWSPPPHQPISFHPVTVDIQSFLTSLCQPASSPQTTLIGLCLPASLKWCLSESSTTNILAKSKSYFSVLTLPNFGGFWDTAHHPLFLKCHPLCFCDTRYSSTPFTVYCLTLPLESSFSLVLFLIVTVSNTQSEALFSTVTLPYKTSHMRLRTFKMVSSDLLLSSKIQIYMYVISWLGCWICVSNNKLNAEHLSTTLSPSLLPQTHCFSSQIIYPHLVAQVKTSWSSLIQVSFSSQLWVSQCFH